MRFHVRAVNTASDSENKMHDDAVAARYGFRGGLVPGVTVYGYLAAAVCEHFGPDWLERGAMDFALHQPLYHDDELRVDLCSENGGRVQIQAGEFASGTAWIHDETPVEMADENIVERKALSLDTLARGTVLGTIHPRIDLAQSRLSAPLDPALHGRAHPAILLSLANQIFVDNYQLGLWIHAASQVRKFGSAKDGDTLCVRARIEDRFEKKGHQFVVLLVNILKNGRTIEQVRHTAIWKPRFV